MRWDDGDFKWGNTRRSLPAAGDTAAQHDGAVLDRSELS
jgi:hypothetical protein